MEASYSHYDYKKSLERIDEILDSADASYEDHKGIPSRNNLTFSNGYYVDVTVVFVDLRESKILADKHKRPVLAKIMRAYISEVIAVMRGDETISEIYIEGDGVWGVFNTTTNEEVNRVFETVGRISSVIDIMNIKLTKKKYTPLSVGIGIEDGTTLYIKAGYKGSGINEVVWVGNIVGMAAKLCNFGNKSSSDEEIMVSERVYNMLEDKYKKFFTWNSVRECYNCSVINVLMNDWVKANG